MFRLARTPSSTPHRPPGCSVLLATSLFLTAIFSTNLAADDRYTARFSEDLRLVEAELCFDGKAPTRLYRHSTAAEYATALNHEGQPLSVRGNSRLRLPALPDNACLEWTFDLGAVTDAGGYRSAFRVDDSVLSLTNLWFWKGPMQRPLITRVELPDGYSFSTPWPEDPENPGWYRPVKTPAGWYTRSAVGRFHQSTIPLSGGAVELALLGDLDKEQIEKLTTWIATTVDAVVPVFGFFPRKHVQVVVVPQGPRSEPVPWAHVVRGGGSAVQFYVDETRPLEEFNADWTATHEFSHLLLPYVARSDRWLSEGLASYYQNVLRARDGRLSQQEAWQQLHAGFGRGQRGTRQSGQNETLREATSGGWENVMRVYWSGAAMMLEADIALRELSNGTQSLDTALKQFHDCCLDEGRLWQAREVLDTLDKLTGTSVFSTVYKSYVDSVYFPDVESSFEALGIRERNGEIQLVDQARLIGIREKIMRGDRGEKLLPEVLDSAP